MSQLDTSTEQVQQQASPATQVIDTVIHDIAVGTQDMQLPASPVPPAQDTAAVNPPPAPTSKSPVPQASDPAEEESSEEESEDDGRGVSVTPPREKEPR